MFLTLLYEYINSSFYALRLLIRSQIHRILIQCVLAIIMNLLYFQDLQKILDNAKDGVVYLNFGSNVRSSELPLLKKQAFLKVFSELNQTVLWKWEDDTLTNIPSNIVIRKWFQQKEILGQYHYAAVMS